MMQRYTPKLHPSGHVDMVPDDLGSWCHYADAMVEAGLTIQRTQARTLAHWDEPTKPDRWHDGTLLRAQEGEE